MNVSSSNFRSSSSYYCGTDRAGPSPFSEGPQLWSKQKAESLGGLTSTAPASPSSSWNYGGMGSPATDSGPTTTFGTRLGAFGTSWEAPGGSSTLRGGSLYHSSAQDHLVARVREACSESTEMTEQVLVAAGCLLGARSDAFLESFRTSWNLLLEAREKYAVRCLNLEKELNEMKELVATRDEEIKVFRESSDEVARLRRKVEEQEEELSQARTRILSLEKQLLREQESSEKKEWAQEAEFKRVMDERSAARSDAERLERLLEDERRRTSELLWQVRAGPTPGLSARLEHLPQDPRYAAASATAVAAAAPVLGSAASPSPSPSPLPPQQRQQQQQLQVEQQDQQALHFRQLQPSASAPASASSIPPPTFVDNNNTNTNKPSHLSTTTTAVATGQSQRHSPALASNLPRPLQQELWPLEQSASVSSPSRRALRASLQELAALTVDGVQDGSYGSGRVAASEGNINNNNNNNNNSSINGNIGNGHTDHRAALDDWTTTLTGPCGSLPTYAGSGGRA